MGCVNGIEGWSPAATLCEGAFPGPVPADSLGHVSEAVTDLPHKQTARRPIGGATVVETDTVVALWWAGSDIWKSLGGLGVEEL